MTLGQIRNLLHGTEPFTLRMVSGREYRVVHPDYAALGRDNATVIISSDDGLFEIVRLSQVESVNVTKESAA